jgi:predicted phosphodiesterase
MQQVSKAKEWSVEEKEYLFLAKNNSVPYVVIARNLNRTAESCKSMWLRHDWSKEPFYSKTMNMVKKDKKAAFENSIANSVEQKLEMFRMRNDMISDRIEKAIRKIPKINVSPYRPKNKKTIKKSEDMAVVLSDLHIGHAHTLEETGGLSEYGVDIFRKRLKNLEVAVESIYELHTHLYNIPTLHVMCLGDIVDGMNQAGSWSPVYIDTPIFDQMFIGVNEIASILSKWLTVFDNVVFYGVRGNHGRIAPSGAEKDYANWDSMAYETLRLMFKDNPRIKFVVPRTWWIMEKIRGKNFLLVHGDQFRPKGSAAKGLEMFSMSQWGMTGKKPDVTICGHFHESSEMTNNFGKIVVNGSFVGGDVYSIKNLQKCGRPEQKIFGINEKHGISFRYDIDLEAQR